MEEGESGRNKRQKTTDFVRGQTEERGRSHFPEHRIQAKQFMDQFESEYRKADKELSTKERFVDEHPNDINDAGGYHRDLINFTISSITQDSVAARDTFKQMRLQEVNNRTMLRQIDAAVEKISLMEERIRRLTGRLGNG